MPDMLKWALLYRQKYKFSVIPVGKNKRPLISWEEYQKRRPDIYEIKGWWKEWKDANIGIVTGKISNLCVVDIDNQEGEAKIAEYIPDSLTFPVAYTPHGKHYYFRYPGKKITNKARMLPGCDLRAEGGYIVAPPSVNKEGKKWMWMKDLSILNVDIPAFPESLIEFLEKNHPSYEPHQVKGEYFQYGRRDEDLFHTANCLIKGGMREDMVRFILTLLAEYCYSFGKQEEPPEKWAKTKVNSALKRALRKEMNVTEELRKFIAVTNGYFSVTDCYQLLPAVTSQQKTAVRVALHKMAKKGEIKKHKKKDGLYRKIEQEVEPLDWKNAPVEDLDINLPLGLSALVKIYPGNVIVIAGTSNAGKTAYLLNFIKDNMHQYEIHYFTSEMGASEMKTRLEKFEGVNEWKFYCWERASNFGDVIRPDAINVIDFLEIYDEFYKVGAEIKEIWEKLKKGIALVALQKNPNTDYGLGGMRGLEKPRLYLAMDKNRIKIVKAKNWRTFENPNGLVKYFKLVQGWRFIPTSGWEKEE